MARTWTTLGRQIGWLAPRLVVSGSARVIAQLQRSGMLPRTVGTLVTGMLSPTGVLGPVPQALAMPGRPVASVLRPTAKRARPVIYAPDLAGPAHPGEVVWTWAHLDDEPGRDQPVLIVGRDDTTLLGLVLTGDPARTGTHDWVPIGPATWADEHHPAWVRMDQVLDVPEAGIRREGAVLDRPAFDLVARRLCGAYRWR